MERVIQLRFVLHQAPPPAEVIYDICDGTQVVETDELAVEMLGEVSSSLTVVETCGSFLEFCQLQFNWDIHLYYHQLSGL